MVFPVHRDEGNDSCINYMPKKPHSSKNDGDHHLNILLKQPRVTDNLDPLDNERFINFTRILESLEWSSKLSLSFIYFSEKEKPSIIPLENKSLANFIRYF